MSDLPAIREDLQDPTSRMIAAVRDPVMLEQLEVALPENVKVDRFVRVAATALRENAAELQRCEPKTVMAAVIRCAQDGLMPDGVEAALVRYGQKAVYLPMIGGYRKIAAEYGWQLQTRVVYANDDFDYELGLHPNVVHRPARLTTDRGEPIAAYAIGLGPNGARELEVMDRAQIEEVRATSRSKDSGPWVNWWTRMAEKTVGRRLFKKLPLADSQRVASVVSADEAIPADATERLYGAGPAAPPQRAQLPPVEESPRPAEGERPSESSAAPAAGAEEAAFEGEEPAEVDEGQAALEVEPSEEQAADDPIVEQAGQVKFDAGKHAGSTIAEVHAEGEAGERYLRWAAKSWNGEPVKSAVTTYVAKKIDQGR